MSDKRFLYLCSNKVLCDVAGIELYVIKLVDVVAVATTYLLHI